MRWPIMYVRTGMLWMGLLLGTVNACTGRDSPGHAADKRIGVTLLTKNHEFYRQLEAGLRDESRQKGYDLIVTSGEFDLAKQQAQIDNFIVQGVDAIVACPVDSKGIAPAIKRAQAAHIPVFTADIRAQDAPVVSHIASDNIAGGRLAADFVARAIHDHGNVGVIGLREVQTGLDREQGFVAALAAHPDIHVVSTLNGGGVRDRSLKATEDMLQAHPELKAIFGINDESALGALAAALSRGRTDLVIVGYDATPEAVRAIKAGTPLKADVAQDPRVIGVRTIDVIAAFFAKQPIDSLISIPVKLVDASNAP